MILIKQRPDCRKGQAGLLGTFRLYCNIDALNNKGDEARMLKLTAVAKDCLLLEGGVMLCPEDIIGLGVYNRMGISYRAVCSPNDDQELMGFEMML